jgi:hypothetical protein
MTELDLKYDSPNDAKPVLAAVLSREDKKKLLENAKTFEWLTMKQLLKLIWWEWFYKKKIEAFYNGLNMGKAAIFAYKDAEHCC